MSSQLQSAIDCRKTKPLINLSPKKNGFMKIVDKLF